MCFFLVHVLRVIEHDRAFEKVLSASKLMRRQDMTIVGVRGVSCSSRCFFGFVRKPSAFVMSFVYLLSSVYKDRKVLAFSLVDNQRSFLSTPTNPKPANRAAQTGVFDLDIRISNRPFIDVCKSFAAETGLQSRNVEKRINAV
jgi:hypothetical protein